MAAKTNTEAIRDLEQTVAQHVERLERTREIVEHFRADHSKLGETVKEIDKRLAVLEVLFAELRKALEERDRRHWALWLAFFGSLLTLLLNAVLLFFGRK